MSTPSVRIWLGVHTGDHAGSSGAGSSLWYRDLETAYLPRERDGIHILRSEEGDWDVLAYVKRAYWDGDGSAHVTLVGYHIDPSEQMQRHTDGKYRSPWWTDRDGDLLAQLETSGWNRYTGRDS